MARWVCPVSDLSSFIWSGQAWKYLHAFLRRAFGFVFEQTFRPNASNARETDVQALCDGGLCVGRSLESGSQTVRSDVDNSPPYLYTCAIAERSTRWVNCYSTQWTIMMRVTVTSSACWNEKNNPTITASPKYTIRSVWGENVFSLLGAKSLVLGVDN